MKPERAIADVDADLVSAFVKTKWKRNDARCGKSNGASRRGIIQIEQYFRIGANHPDRSHQIAALVHLVINLHATPAIRRMNRSREFTLLANDAFRRPQPLQHNLP